MQSNRKSPSPAARRKARRFVLQALYEWQLSRNNVGDIEKRFLTVNDMKKVDVAYFHELFHGIPARLDVLDDLLAGCLDRPIQEVSQVEKAILRIGAYELLERPDVPFPVVISEGMELARHFGSDESYRYINAVLDKLARALRQPEVAART